MMTRRRSSRSGPVARVGHPPPLGGSGGGGRRLFRVQGSDRGPVPPRLPGPGRRRRSPAGALLPDLHHPRATGADHARAGGQGLLRDALVPVPVLSAHVALAQYSRQVRARVLLVRPVQDLLETKARLDPGRESRLPQPPEFQVENFASDKSVGQTSLFAKYTLKVFKGDPGPGNKELASYQISTRLVKGPDRMWYLTSGTLPTERR